MQPGDIVMIYQYPVTQTDPEGRATLVREISPDEGDGLSRWVVRFWDEPESCYARTIYVDPLQGQTGCPSSPNPTSARSARKKSR